MKDKVRRKRKTSHCLIQCLLFSLFISHAGAEEPETLDKKEQDVLLTIARDTLTLYLNKKTVPAIENYTLSKIVKRTSGVFVTLKEKKTEKLRGCIGYITGIKPLVEAVIDCTIQASTRDRRFTPMKKGEDETVYIEISALTTPRKISSINDIEVGKHGLILSEGFKSGVLLPQVPLEWGWSRDDFLKAICRKAGLPDRAWERGATLYGFTAQVFGEYRKD